MLSHERSREHGRSGELNASGKVPGLMGKKTDMRYGSYDKRC